MRTFVVLWLMLDVVAAVVILSDYRKWYGHVHRLALVRRRMRMTQRKTVQTRTATTINSDDRSDNLAVNG